MKIKGLHPMSESVRNTIIISILGPPSGSPMPHKAPALGSTASRCSHSCQARHCAGTLQAEPYPVICQLLLNLSATILSGVLQICPVISLSGKGRLLISILHK